MSPKKKTKPDEFDEMLDPEVEAKLDLSVKDPKCQVPDSIDTEDTAWLDEGFVPPDKFDVTPDEAKLVGDLMDIPLERILPNDWNPNKMSDKEFDMLVRRIKEVGNYRPINVVALSGEKDGFYRIVDGEHRYRAHAAIGHTTIPALVFKGAKFQDEDAQKFIGMQANMIHGRLDPVKFVKMVQSLATRYNEKAMQDLMGFVDKSKWKMFTQSVENGLPPEMRDKFREKAKDARPDELGGILQELMGRYGNDLRYNFMIFSFEDLENIWVRMNPETRLAFQELAEHCRSRGVDINMPLADGLRAASSSFVKE